MSSHASFTQRLMRATASAGASLAMLCAIGSPLALLAPAPAALAADGSWLSAIDAGRPGAKSAPHVLVEIVSEKDALTPQAENRLAVRFTHENGWHTYWRMPGDAGLPPEFTFTLPEGLSASEPGFTLPARMETAGLTSFGYGGVTLFPFRVEVPRGAAGPVTVKLHAEYLVCRDMCVPESADATVKLPVRVSGGETPDAAAISEALRAVPERVEGASIASATIEGDRIRIDVPKSTAAAASLDFLPLRAGILRLSESPRTASDAAAAPESTSLWLAATEKFSKAPADRLEGVLVGDGGPAKGGWAVETTIRLAPGAVPPPPQSASAPAAAPAGGGGQAALALSAWTAILSAFLGGLILNLMPCVFPVLSLKLLDLVRGAHAPGRMIAHGAAFTGGVLLTMLALSGLLLGLRGAGYALGWGFQLQSPGVVAGLMLLFGAITFNLLGVYEFTAGSRIADAKAVRGAPRDGLAGSLVTGVLAVIVASPCTAPFMGASLGYALTQPALEALLVFLALGLGMAAPWMLLCVFPGWARRLPKPGPWMDVFRRIMAIPMALAVLWLAWVLARQAGGVALIAVVCGLGALGVFCWLVGRRQWGRPHSPVLMAAMLAIAIGTTAAAGSGLLGRAAPESAQAHGAWQPWSEAAVSRALADGRPVFVDFTAAWCITCQANKLAALSRDEVSARMDALGYVRLEADWTNRDPQIARVLAEHGRSGVPLYLILTPGGGVETLPELLTPGVVIEALERNARGK